ncbi:MAG: AAA family ATPase [Clostridia bacterium]|nr:AAA family ATPase [Clostridia bacterium]
MSESVERKRIIDNILDEDLRVMGAVLLEGPKRCGKSFTAEKVANSTVDFRDENKKDGYVKTSENACELLLQGESPRLFVEWQSAPRLWDSIRYSVDCRNKKGLFILTGQDSNYYSVMHPGVGRYAVHQMWPMSLYESGESNGQISLGQILDDPGAFHHCTSDVTMTGIIDAMFRGGWPECVSNPSASTDCVKKIYDGICDEDVPTIYDYKKGNETTKAVISSYARNLSSTHSVYPELMNTCGVSFPTLSKYISALKQLYIIEDIAPWPMRIRSSAHRTMSDRHNLADPSLAIYTLGAKRDDLNTDYNLLNRIFKCMCYRDIKVYSEARFGKISHYEDRYGLSVDCILTFNHSKYALIDFEFGQHDIEKCIDSLNRLENAIKKHIEEQDEGAQIEMPVVKIVLTGTEYGFMGRDGVLVIPVGCLKD